jgi:NAD(P)-dependent dehydrogenase (short-subunit alcohol dehydrogenase family)
VIDLDLRGRSALVAGGSRGIGVAISKRLAVDEVADDLEPVATTGLHKDSAALGFVQLPTAGSGMNSRIS